MTEARCLLCFLARDPSPPYSTAAFPKGWLPAPVPTGWAEPGLFGSWQHQDAGGALAAGSGVSPRTERHARMQSARRFIGVYGRQMVSESVFKAHAPTASGKARWWGRGSSHTAAAPFLTPSTAGEGRGPPWLPGSCPQPR